MQRSSMSKLLRKCLLGVAIAGQCSIAYASEYNYSSDEEAFLIRRIAEFWKDGDFTIVKTQINDFLQKYPSSSMQDYLQGILGDLFLQENNYAKALEAYQTVSNSEIKNKIILNKLQCYYELDQYEAISNEGENYLSYSSDDFETRKNEFHFVMAESYFRRALDSKDTELAKELSKKAEPYYEELLDSEYSEVSSFALAEVYRILGESSKGADLYLVLAERYPAKKESLLFNAALLESNLDKDAAIEIFDRIIAMRGVKAQEAAYNRLILYYQTKQYDNVVSNHRLVYPHVADEDLPTYHFIVGKSYYALEDYESAITPLEQFVLEQNDPTDQYKDALLIQMTSAKQIGNEEVFSKALERFSEAYPDDQELGKAHFMHAMILKKEGDLASVESSLKTIVDKYPDFEDKESLLYEYAVITHQNEKYDISYDMFKNFISSYPESDRIQSSWRYFLSSCLHLSNQAKDSTDISYSKDVFLSDLQKVLSSDSGLSSDELREYRLLYAKLAYELNYYNESLETLGSYIGEYREHNSLAEAHMLTALNLNKLSSDLEGFCDHLETALTISPDKYDTSPVHLQLFNAYIARSEHSENSQELTKKAADYLYIALKDDNADVKLENQLWLGGYFYNQTAEHLKNDWTASIYDNESVTTSAQKALEVYEKALLNDEDSLISINEESLYAEPEALKFAELAGEAGQKERKYSILASLVENQKSKESLNWKFKRQAIFELAKTYEDLKDDHAALDAYEEIVSNYSQTVTPITNASKLKAATLSFSLLDSADKKENNKAVLKVLNDLKELQIRKNVISEPTHLEAALNYAQIRASLSEKNMKDSRYLFFLSRMKEDFTSKEDSIGSNYHEELAQNSQTQKIYKCYMDFVDAEILRMQSRQLMRENKRKEAQERKDQAYALLTSIDNASVPTEFLQKQVNASLKKL